MGLISGKGISSNTIKSRHILFENNMSFQMKDSGAVTQNVFKMNGDSFTFEVMPLSPNVNSGGSNQQVANKYYVDTEIANALSGASSGTTWLAPIIAIENDDTNISNPNAGDRYLVGTSAVNGFAGHDNEIAVSDGTNWSFITPKSGDCIYPEYNANVMLTYTTLWQERGFEGSTVSGNLLTLSGSNISFASIANNSILIGQLTGEPVAKTLNGDATINNNGTITIADDAITENKLASAVSDKLLGSGNVTTATINDGAVTEAKLSSAVQTKLNAPATTDAQNHTTAVSEDNEVIAAQRMMMEMNINSGEATNESASFPSKAGHTFVASDFTFYAHGTIFIPNITVTYANADSGGNKTHTVTVDWGGNADLKINGQSELEDGDTIGIEYPVLNLDR